ncbi:MerR family transcriptional regulator [Mariniflexile litorale]|uniref:MerR family transcriptional regulator n=1 Tax=Mariniflexile litorale TaxID=3045158 RepID=A0AAU7EH07_9FLAO|nr:MerR family transcriptional regulator [Mariniflexile sp. KMM 9835]MDQ8210816.1 MerR family transcriptional regulator [Mariniflexile sp. KMM 9835]
MNNIKVNFSIKDLENLTGVKAHTIRIWEKRYNLLSPNRSDTNIRNYNISSLQKLLNISYLNNNGFKISKIADLKEADIANKVRELALKDKTEDHAINAFKIAMINFDQVLFYNTYNNLLSKNTFSKIFYNTFLPLLDEIGLLWQTNTITPAHEHFISVLIKQKILLNIENLQSLNPKPDTKTFVLFLPEQEIHDIGLLFVNYQLRSKGYHTIFLGESVPMDSLKDLFSFFNNICFVSYFTVYPEEESITSYLNNFSNLLLKNNNSKLMLLGQKVLNYDSNELPTNILIYKSIENLVKDL